MIYFRRNHATFIKHSVKQYVTPLPLVGHMAYFHLGLEYCADHSAKFYNKSPKERIIRKNTFINDLVMIRGFDLAEKIAFKYYKGQNLYRHSLLGKTKPRISVSDQEWKKICSVLSPAFTTNKFCKMMPSIVTVGENMIELLKKKMEESKHTKNPFYARIGEFITPGQEKMAVAFLTTMTPVLAKILVRVILSEKCREFFGKVVSDVKNDPERIQHLRHHIINFLILANEALSDEEIIAQILLLILEDFETVAALINYLCELAVNIDVLGLLAKEIREYDANNNGEMSSETLKELENLRIVLLEFLRLWHPFMVLYRQYNKN